MAEPTSATTTTAAAPLIAASIVCISCTEPFDLDDRTPLFLDCAHIACRLCVENTSECPVCRRAFKGDKEGAPRAEALVWTLEEQQQHVQEVGQESALEVAAAATSHISEDVLEVRLSDCLPCS